MKGVKKVIPCLDVTHGRLVKGVHFTELKDMGDPVESAAAYSAAGADEIVFLDISATIEGKNTLLDTVKRTVSAIKVPLIVGGGIKTLADIERILDIGAAKVSLNTAAVKNPALVESATKQFGSVVIVAMDTIASTATPSGFELVLQGGTEPTGIDAVVWAKQAEALGANALLPTSKETDGTRKGYDIPLTRAIADAVTIPVIASGGAGELSHLYEAISQGHAEAVLVASIVHFGLFSIRQIKEFLREKGVSVLL